MLNQILVGIVALAPAWAAIIFFLNQRRKRRRQLLANIYIPITPSPSSSMCQHGDLIEVDEHVTGEIVAYICGKCSEQLPVDDREAIRFRKYKEIADEWMKMKDQILPPSSEEDASFAQEVLRPQVEAVIAHWEHSLGR